MQTQYDELIKFFSTTYDLEERLVKAICYVESSFQPFASRYEPMWRFVSDASKYAYLCKTTVQTEIMQQSTSWGLMQVMGSVARELKFINYLPMLCLPEHGIEMGCKQLARLSKKYVVRNDLAAAYNAGEAKHNSMGKYINQEYVDKVMKAYDDMA